MQKEEAVAHLFHIGKLKKYNFRCLKIALY